MTFSDIFPAVPVRVSVYRTRQDCIDGFPPLTQYMVDDFSVHANRVRIAQTSRLAMSLGYFMASEPVR